MRWLLEKKLTDRGHHVERQKAITCVIDGITFDETFRADLIVDGCVVVEVKAAEKLSYVFAPAPDLYEAARPT